MVWLRPAAMACVVALLAMAGECMAANAKENAVKYRVYVGGYTGPANKGIVLCEFDPASGELTAKGLAAETPNPSFLAIHPTLDVIYAANELYGPGKSPGKVSAFAIDRATGRLGALGEQPSGGAGPCHVSLDPAGKCLMVANYGSGSVSSIPVAADGRLGEPGTVIQHTGKGPNTKRQEGPHAHAIYPDSTGRFAFAIDLGLDQVLVYSLDAQRGTMSQAPVCIGTTPPGEGPRHLAWSTDRSLIYVTNEMGGTVTTFRWSPQAPSLTAAGTISSLPAGYGGAKSSAEIELHPNGRFLFVSNRGDNTIATLQVEQGGGLKLIATAPCGGKSPRHIALDPSGKWMLVSNQESDNVVVMRVDGGTGRVEPAGSEVGVPKAVCAIFARP